VNPPVPEIPPPARRPPPSPPEWLALAAVLVVALALRLAEAHGARLWFDEIYAVMVARRELPDLFAIAAQDIHPPLYFVLLHVWRLLGGEGEGWLRVPSLAAALAGIAATWALGRRFWSPRTGLLAAAFLALSNPHIHHSQEVEVHAWLWLLAVLAVLGAAGWVETRRRADAVLFVAASALGAWTHYLALVVLLLTAVWGVAALHRERGALPRWLGLVALPLLLFAPQVPNLAAQWVREGSGAYFHWPSHEGLRSLGHALSLGVLYLFPAFAAFALAALGDRERGRWAALPWVLCALTPLFTRAWPWVLTRDMLVVLPFWYLLVAAGLDRSRWRGAGLAVAALLLLSGARAWSRHRPFPEPRALARAERVVDARMPPGTVLLHTETHSLLFFRFYRPRDRSLLLFPAGERVPFFDAGLVIPDAWRVSPEAWARRRAAGEPWWGVHLDRAYVTRGVASRAGDRPRRWIDSLATGQRWAFPPAFVWEGAPAVGPRRIPAGRMLPPGPPRRGGGS
jgi:hypothetical protein